MTLLQLYFEFFKTGLFAVGGGLATLPFLQDISVRTGWFTQAQLSDMIAVSESTPGPMGVNMATYVGFTTAGLPGSICATLGLITPSIIIILLIALSLKAFRDNKYVDSAFYGLRPASTGLIAASGLSVLLMALWNSESTTLLDGIQWKGVILFAVLLVLTRWCKPTKKLHPIFFILGSAVIGIVFGF
ncbi:MAG: chromate transporter [Eubacteriales bacterium]|nr:chromate transporter [Eubacteriales bacterium]